MRKISILGLFVGGVVSFFSAAILSIPFGIFASAKVGILKRPPNAQMAEAIRAITFSTPGIYYGDVALDCLCCILGGYLAAVTARRSESLNGLASSLLFVVVQVFAINQRFDPHPMPVQILQVTGIVLCSWLGGCLRSVQLRSTRSKITVART